MVRSVGLFSDDVTLLHQRRRMCNICRIPVWREFCPGVNHVCIFIFLLNNTKCLNLVIWFVYYHRPTGIISTLGKRTKGTRNPTNIPFSPLLPPQWYHQGTATYPSWATLQYLVPKANWASSAPGNIPGTSVAIGLKNNWFKATFVYNPLSDLCLFMSWIERLVVLKMKSKANFREGAFLTYFFNADVSQVSL